MVQFDHFDTAKDVPDLSGKVILLTGGTGGVGKQAVLQLAAHNPSQIFFTGRNKSAAESIISSAASSSSTKLTFLPMELTSLKDIKATADKILASTYRLDVFIANAGMISDAGVTQDGYEVQFGTNHLGNAALLLHLLPLMLKTAKTSDKKKSDVRFVALSSLGYRYHPPAGIDFDTLKSAQADMSFGNWQRYSQSKLANILFARELARRYPDLLTSCAIHPGVVETEFVTEMGFWNRALVRVSQAVQGKSMMTPEQGCVNTVWAATSPDVKGKLGKGKVAFFEPVGKPNGGDEKCFDQALMQKLWEWTEEQVGVKAPAAS